MKKRIFSFIGATGVATVLVVALTLSAPKTQASTSKLASLNVKALSFDGGACTGPKGASTQNCECTNSHACSDQTGCSSSVFEGD